MEHCRAQNVRMSKGNLPKVWRTEDTAETWKVSGIHLQEVLSFSIQSSLGKQGCEKVNLRMKQAV